MKKQKWISLLCTGLVLACAAAPVCAKEDKPETVTLNEVAHSIFYAPQYAAYELGYFAEEGIDLQIVTGFGADKVMTAVLSGEAEIGFMGCESTVYAYNQGAQDYVVNFAQLTQRAGNFLVAREEMPDFQWSDLIGKNVLGGRKGGMPEMVFEYILKQNGIDPQTDLTIDQSIDFGSTAAAFSGGQGEFTVEFEPPQPPWSRRARVLWWRPWAWTRAMCPTPHTAQSPAISRSTRTSSRASRTPCKRGWTM